MENTILENLRQVLNRDLASNNEQHEERRESFRFDRVQRKNELMRTQPNCVTCGCTLSSKPERPNSAHLVGKALYCPQHVHLFRQGGRKRLKMILDKQDGCCSVCHATLSLDGVYPNSVQLDGRRLICATHEPKYQKRAMVKETIVMVNSLTEKGREFLATTQSLVQLIECWYVDGMRYESLAAAETRAIELANIVGSKIDILSGYADQRSLKRVEVVHPDTRMKRVG